MKEDTLAVLRSFPLFKGLDCEGLNRMLQCFPPQLCSYGNKEVIVAGGSLFNGMGIILSGKVAITKETCSGNRIIVAVMEPGEIFGDLMLSSNYTHWTVNVVAHSPCRIVFLSSDKILARCSRLCTGHSTFIVNLFRIVANKAMVFNKRLEHLAARHLRGKVSSYLMENYLNSGSTTLDIPLKRHELADYFNVSRPSLSREMKLMKEDGIIDFKRSRITIKNVASLEKSID